MYQDRSIAVVVPAYREERQIATVIDTMPRWVDHVIVVDDCSPAPDRTTQIVSERAQNDARVDLVARKKNGGVGAAIESGYARALELDADVICVMAGDGQMDPDDLHRIVHPVACGRTDYAKANRLTLMYHWDDIPRTRLFGNMVLSFLTRFATGYWTIGDAQTGFTAASKELTTQFVRRGMYPRYGVPNDLLVTCALSGARVEDVPTKPRYAVGEESKLRPRKVALPIAFLLFKGFWKRMFVRFVVLEANPVPLAYIAGLLSFLLGSIWSIYLVVRAFTDAATPAEVVAASMLFVGGAIMLVLAVVLDVLFSLGLTKRREDWVEAPDPTAPTPNEIAASASKAVA
ncbi:MAG: glycosyltransferase family 2 protein [Acidimicrobiia bacterium]